MEEYVDATSLHWGPYSRRYLEVNVGDKYFYIGVSVGSVGSGWYWVSRESAPLQCGWAPPACFHSTGEYVLRSLLPTGVYEPRLIDVLLQSAQQPQLSSLAVCVSDASVDDRLGFGAAWYCILPADMEEWKSSYATISMRWCGAEAVCWWWWCGRLRRPVAVSRTLGFSTYRIS